MASRAPAYWSKNRVWPLSLVDCSVTYGMSSGSCESASKTRTCGATTTMPSTACARSCARASGMEPSTVGSMLAMLTQ